MLYAILCYNCEDVIGSWTKEQGDATMARLAVVEQKLAKEGRLGPVARLLPTTSATTLRKGREEPPHEGREKIDGQVGTSDPGNDFCSASRCFNATSIAITCNAPLMGTPISGISTMGYFVMFHISGSPDNVK